MKVVRKIIEIDEERCDGCGQCISGCAEGALEIIDGKAKVVADRFCDGLGACIGECPTGALKIVEREAEEFDETAVEARLSELAKEEKPANMACGCPSSRIQVLTPMGKMPRSGENTGAAMPSALSHWPVKIRLIPPDAPFLKNADILVLADCCAAAYPALHPELMQGKVVMMGCPKFDDKELYIQRFAEIFSIADIRHISIAFMEVPCCSALPAIIMKGMKKAGKNIPVTEVIISKKGARTG
ncbi:MAG: 4Fe-4S dicluster domain-containing protein [Desulfococcaceae bacterium]|jgi:ferredoxin|nr:4Fe-4S dicluster domain-containing protein [Desulfococcaceae bacterium]